MASLFSAKLKRLLSYPRPVRSRVWRWFALGCVLQAVARRLVAFMVTPSGEYVLTPRASDSQFQLTIPGGRAIYLNEFFAARRAPKKVMKSIR